MESECKKAQRSPTECRVSFQEDLENRRRRFEQDKPPPPLRATSFLRGKMNLNDCTLVGTCQNLEKGYFLWIDRQEPRSTTTGGVGENSRLAQEEMRQDGNYTYICDHSSLCDRTWPFNIIRIHLQSMSTNCMPESPLDGWPWWV